MAAIDFQQWKDHLHESLAEFQMAIERYPTLGYNDRPTEYVVIRNRFNAIEAELKELSSSAITWPPTVRKWAEEEIEVLTKRVNEIYYGFTHELTEDNRNRLLEGAHVDLEKEEIADILTDDVNEAKSTGQAILEDLSRQRQALGNISNNLNVMDRELDRGSSILNEMECRGRMRRFFLIGVCAFLVLVLIVFIYYILR